MDRVHDSNSDCRSAWVSDGVVYIYNLRSEKTRLLASEGDRPFETVVAVSANYVVATTAVTLHIIYYTLPIVKDTTVWQFDVSSTLHGTFHDEIPSLFMMWADTETFSGLILIPNIGIVHENGVAPLFYPIGYDGGASADLDRRQHAQGFAAPDGVVAQHTIEARAYEGKYCSLKAIDLVWRRRSTTVSAVVLHAGGCVSVSIPLDVRLGYTSASSESNILSVAHMLKVEGGTNIAVHSVGSVEIVCICTGHSLAVVEFVCEPGNQPSSSLQLIKLKRPDVWKVEFDGTTFVVRSGDKIRKIPCTHAPAPPGTD
jgi:hypothetical protein